MQHFGPDYGHFFTPYINISGQILIFAVGFHPYPDRYKMGSKTLTLIIIWFVAVVAFFALWAVLLTVVRRISERRNKKQDLGEDDANRLP